MTSWMESTTAYADGQARAYGWSVAEGPGPRTWNWNAYGPRRTTSGSADSPKDAQRDATAAMEQLKAEDRAS